MKRVTMNYKDNVHNGSSNANFMLSTYKKLWDMLLVRCLKFGLVSGDQRETFDGKSTVTFYALGLLLPV